MENKPDQSKAAIASLVLGILSFVFSIFTAIPALILGIVALVIIGESRGLLKGKGFAIAGIFLAAVPIVIMVFSLVTTPHHARKIQQKFQFRIIELGLELFKNESGFYPDSFDNRNITTDSPVSSQTTDTTNYGGAQKLAEALVGLDLLGFHPDSKFRSNGTDDSGKSLYVPETVNVRKAPYLDIEKVNAFQLNDIFKDIGTFNGNIFVICDVYVKERYSGKKTGMPVLYYKANISSKTMDTSEPVDKRIYNVLDNLSLIRIAGSNGKLHPLAEDNGVLFYDRAYKIIDQKVPTEDRPHNPDTFILISAGPDGLYGTSDDIVNFEE